MCVGYAEDRVCVTCRTFPQRARLARTLAFGGASATGDCLAFGTVNVDRIAELCVGIYLLSLTKSFTSPFRGRIGGGISWGKAPFVPKIAQIRQENAPLFS